MKVNWIERLVVNNPLRVVEQRMEIRWLKGIVPLMQGSQVLEVGCGRGAGARLILEEFQPSLVHALDLDIDMIDKAKGYLSQEERDRICLHVGDVLRLPFKESTFDAVFGFGVLHHVRDWRGCIDEIARVLKRGGVYYIEEIYPSLYQNFITKRLLFHPGEDRFYSRDLNRAMKERKLLIKDAIEFKRIGILGVAIKES
jgi:ubiquinone/menaquinone biosynthesis C-methylase UbiE